jgi:hypothetical protein
VLCPASNYRKKHANLLSAAATSVYDANVLDNYEANKKNGKAPKTVIQSKRRQMTSFVANLGYK